jgi:hypothetical protein
MCKALYPKQLISEDSLAELECMIEFLDNPDTMYEGLYRIQEKILSIFPYLPKTVKCIFHEDLNLTVFCPEGNGTEIWTYLEAKEYIRDEFLGGND